jgi:hypothetical protein
MTLKQKLLAIKQSNSAPTSILLLVDWMLENQYVDMARKKNGWGLYNPTYTHNMQINNIVTLHMTIDDFNI